MENLLKLLENTFNLKENNKLLINNILEKINLNEKDIFITNNLIKNKLDFNSVCAYLISEYNLFDLNIQDEDLIEELVKNRESTKELISSIDENNKLIQAQRATAMASYL